MNTREAEIDDLKDIVRIYNESIAGQWSTADLNPVTVSEKKDWFYKHVSNKRPVWVLEVGAEIAGWISLEWFYQGRNAYHSTAEISTYISPKHQRKGYGTLLKSQMIEKCPSFGIENLISMYFDHNPATEKINEKLGFKRAGHLEKIASINGEKRGLIISILRI